MTRFIIFFSVLVCLFSCESVEPRRPISVRSGIQIRKSVSLNRFILDKEIKLIKKAIEKDSKYMYKTSSHGFWFRHLKINTKANYPIKGHKVRIKFSIKTLNLISVYTEEEIGVIEFVLDKQDAPFLGIRKALKVMREGEKIRAFFPSSLVYSYRGDGDKIGVNVPICCEITLIEIINNKNN